MTTHNSWDDSCFICGSHKMQSCDCDVAEVEKAINAHIDKFKDIKPISFSELIRKLEVKNERMEK